MSEPLSERRVFLRVDETGGDVAALVDLGVLEPQPEPPPDEPAPEPIPEE
ncbi:hypothetical protein [Streptomyces sp. adm13(2018)]|nr:hypothetical protein [Streptomyces sp. adm13(2018)]